MTITSPVLPLNPKFPSLEQQIRDRGLTDFQIVAGMTAGELRAGGFSITPTVPDFAVVRPFTSDLPKVEGGEYTSWMWVMLPREYVDWLQLYGYSLPDECVEEVATWLLMGSKIPTDRLLAWMTGVLGIREGIDYREIAKSVRGEDDVPPTPES